MLYETTLHWEIIQYASTSYLSIVYQVAQLGQTLLCTMLFIDYPDSA